MFENCAYGDCPSVAISHIRTPKDQTSLADEYTRSFTLSGACIRGATGASGGHRSGVHVWACM
jgi:hypothetical protein